MASRSAYYMPCSIGSNQARQSHVCVLQSCLDLLELGYNVHVLADGVSSCNREEVPIALERIRQAGGLITTSESASFQLQSLFSSLFPFDLSSLTLITYKNSRLEQTSFQSLLVDYQRWKGTYQEGNGGSLPITTSQFAVKGLVPGKKETLSWWRSSWFEIRHESIFQQTQKKLELLSASIGYS